MHSLIHREIDWESITGDTTEVSDWTAAHSIDRLPETIDMEYIVSVPCSCRGFHGAQHDAALGSNLGRLH
jgi:hypothetical protein